MKTIHDKYIRLTGKENAPKVMVLDNKVNGELMRHHVEEHFDSSITANGATIDEFLDIHKTSEGLECDVLVRCKGEKESVYFELQHINDGEVQETLKRLPVGGELHLHLKGKDSEEISRQLEVYFAARRTEPIKRTYNIGRKYEQEGYLCVNVKIKNEHGLHARPASLFVTEANNYKADIYAIKGKQEVSAKSIMGLMLLAADKGSVITLRAKGEDAEKALDGLYKLCNNRFGEYKTKSS